MAEQPRVSYAIAFDGKRRQYVVIRTVTEDAEFFDSIIDAQSYVARRRAKL